MRAVLASVVDGKALLQVIWVSIAAGIGVTVVFAIGLVGATRAVDLSRDGHMAEAALYAALAVVATAAVLLAVVFAIVVMTNK